MSVSPPTDTPQVYQPDRRNVWNAMWRGYNLRCPNCGQGKMFTAYLKVADQCGTCTTPLHHQRADDAPPYFTMFIVGHVVLGGVLALERQFAPPAWVHLVIWMPLALVLCAYLLGRIKGIIVALQWALRMHGFGEPTKIDPNSPVDELASGTAQSNTTENR